MDIDDYQDYGATPNMTLINTTSRGCSRPRCNRSTMASLQVRTRSSGSG